MLDFLVGHSRGVLVVVAVGALIALGAILYENDEPVAESRSSPGYEIVRDLKREGAIDGFEAVEAEDGWDTEYSLDDGYGYIRFRGNEMEAEASGELRDAVNRVAADAGFTAR